MNWLCLLGLHRWVERTVLAQTFEETGSTINYEDDVCARCLTLRDPQGVADAYAIMANMRGKIEIHPDVTAPPSTTARNP